MNCYILKTSETAVVYKKMNNETVKKFLNSFMLKKGAFNFNNSDEYIFRIGTTKIPLLPENKEYALNVDENGICIIGRDYRGLMHGFFSLLFKFEYENGEVKIRHTTEESNYLIDNRMIHICVFPENNLYYIKKLIRFAALCQYTHIVIEFWGMLKFDCLKELSWENAFTKSEAKEIIDECHDLGIEPIPMFNQLGHASGSRVCYGKHVVLDQNPALQELFTPDGWAWNIYSDDVFKLLKSVRSELYELFGSSEYMHIGCDEAYYISRHSEWRRELPKYLEKLTKEVEKEGKRPMMWMDMLLEEGKFPHCYTAGKIEESEKLRSSVAKSTIFVDWQYDCRTAPIPSLEFLGNCGHDCMGAPWFDEQNYAAHIATLTKHNMFGLMFTTWHTLNQHMASILNCAKLCGAKSFVWNDGEETAAIFRKISFEGNTYNDCGWSEKQMEV